VMDERLFGLSRKKRPTGQETSEGDEKRAGKSVGGEGEGVPQPR